MNQLFRKKSVQQIIAQAKAGELADAEAGHSMNRVLTARDLTFMGIAAIVGAGIFSTIGSASFSGGPGIILLFLFVSVACGFSAVCYAEFASMVPVSGSAYTYSYVAFGELVAWIIGWDLLMEYAIGNIAVAISWSDYFTSLLDGFGWHIPRWLTMDYWTAKDMASPDAIAAWNKAPLLFGKLRLICDLPAFLVTVVITWIIYIGIKESKRSMNAMVILKLAIILLVIVAGAFYVAPDNWHPFLPNGMGGVMAGTAAVFFSYIGFDAISTTAEECKDPQRDLPKGMFNSLIICTVVYIAVALVLTGMTSYKNLNIGDPLSYVFHQLPGKWPQRFAGLIEVSAVIATASVLLVFQLGQPRIWMSMSRDGLLPPIFSKMHKKYRTPSFSTILTGLVVGIPALFMNLTTVVNLTSVGTLFAFVLVCGGIIRMDNMKDRPPSKFKTPYINGKWIVPALFIAGVALLYQFNRPDLIDFVHNRRVADAETMQTKWTAERNAYTVSWLTQKAIPFETINKSDTVDLKSIPAGKYQQLVRSLPLPESERFDSGWSVFRYYFMFWLFLVVALITTIYTFIKSYSLIPVLGFLSCTYLLSESGTSNWERFLVWLLIGLILYFVYGYKHSKLGKADRMEASDLK